MGCKYNYKGEWLNENQLYEKYTETPHFKSVVSSTPPEKYSQTLANRLTKSFDRVGVSTRIVSNSLLASVSRVYEGEDRQKIIEFNPTKVHNESILHEYGHIYVDLIRDQSLIEDGIKQLEGTDLWLKIEMFYPELSGIALGKEVLTTAIGMKANEIFNTELAQTKWQKFITKIFNTIKNILGLESKDIAEQLARELVSGNIHRSLDRRVKMTTQHMKDFHKEQLLENTIKYLNNKLNIYNTQIDQYKNIDNQNYTKSLKEAANSIRILMRSKEPIDLLNAVNKSILHDSNRLRSLEKRALSAIEQYQDKRANLDELGYEELFQYAKLVNDIRLFHSSFRPVEKVFTLTKDMIGDAKEEDKDLINLNNTLIEQLQHDMLPRVANLYNSYDILKTKFVAFIISNTSDSNKRDSDFDARAKQMLADGFIDETRIQATLDGILDTHEEFTANLKKIVRVHLTDAEFEAQKYQREFEKRYKEFIRNGGQISQIINEEEGALLRKWNFKLFYEDFEERQAAAIANGNEYSKSTFIQEVTTRVIPGEEDYNHDRFQEIVEEQIARTKLDKTHHNYLSKFEFHTWFRKNVVELEVNEELALSKVYKYAPKIGGIYQPLNDEYINEGWKTMQANSNARLFHEYMFELMETMTEHVMDIAQKDGVLPAKANDFTDFESVQENESLTNTAGEVVYNIPFNLTGYLSQKQVFKIPEQYVAEPTTSYEARVLQEAKDKGYGEFESFAALKDAMDKRIEENKEFHKNALTLQIDKSIPEFIYSAMIHKVKSEMESLVLLHQAIVKYSKIQERTGLGNTMFEKLKRRLDGARETAEKFDSNLAYHVAKDLEMNYYERWTKTQRGDKFLKQMKNYTSLLGIGFNVFSAVKNVTYGGFMSAAEAHAGYHFTKADLRNGAAMYWANSGSMIKDATGIEVEENFELALLKKFDVLGSIRDHFERELTTTNRKAIMKAFMGLAYFMQGTGEHAMYGGLLFAMLKSNRIIDGTAMSLQQYMLYKGFDGRLKKSKSEVTQRDYDDLKSTEERLKKEFKAAPSLIESLELIDGMIVSKKDANGNDLISQLKLAEFKEKNRRVAHKIHGIYNKSDKGTIENTRLGELVMQFRHWARPGWNKRFGSRGGLFKIDEYWNETRGEVDQGSYKALVKMLRNAYMDTRDGMLERKNKEKLSAMESAAAVLISMWDLITHMKYYGHSMTKQEMADIRRVFAELLFLAVVFAALQFLKSLAADDDDLKKKRWFAFLMYQLDASRAELLGFTPPGFINEGLKMLSNPTATLRTFIDGYNFTEQLLMYPFISDHGRIVQSGLYKGEYKVVRYGKKIVPVLNPLQRWMNLGKGDYKSYNYK